MKKTQHIHLIAGARPNFMKIAPLYHQLSQNSRYRLTVIHTGQHYDKNMSDDFFADLRLPAPDHYLNVGSGSHAEQTGNTMIAYEPICQAEQPDLVVVVGDINATVACALTAKKLHCRVAHLEAGLRSFDRSMPEELNRLMTDAISDILWTPSQDADHNLAQEGVPAHRIECVGNIMIDAFEMQRVAIEARAFYHTLNMEKNCFATVTLHRPSNVDQSDRLNSIVEQLLIIADDVPLIFPIHPRTEAALKKADLLARLQRHERVIITPPLSYLDFMSLVVSSQFIVTDSGGIQEETTYVGIPCFTVRENTERPITIHQGTNRLVKIDDIAAAVGARKSTLKAGHTPPKYWDGQTALRIEQHLQRVVFQAPADAESGCSIA